MPINPATIQCPGCDLLLPEEDLETQMGHLKKSHPDIYQARMENAGFQLVDGEGVDTLSSDD